jgi:haloalkane dehalogenase
LALPSFEGIAYRESGPPDGPAVLMLHGYPESSYMWRAALEAAAAAGFRAVAPDLPGFGDSPPDPPGTWEHHIQHVERLRDGLGLDDLVLVAHDWGGLIGLRWACDNPDRVRALVISASGFFPDGKWHGMARGLREEDTGEQLVADMTRTNFAALLAWASRGMDDETIDEFWKCFDGDERRRAQLELYRSGDFEKLAPYDGKLAALGVPTLLLWGGDDQFAPVAGAKRFESQLPDAELVVLEGVGHFVWEDEPERSSRELARFLEGL